MQKEGQREGRGHVPASLALLGEVAVKPPSDWIFPEAGKEEMSSVTNCWCWGGEGWGGGGVSSGGI